MSSDRQIAANKLNSKNSTGPRTPAGKQRVSSNALKHGLTGIEVVLPSENPEDFDSFRVGLMADLAPQGDLECALAEKIVADLWRLRRVAIFEAALYRRGCQELVVNQAAEVAKSHDAGESERILELLQHGNDGASERQARADAHQKLARERAKLDESSLKVTRVLEASPQPFSNLWRHESAVSRSVFRTLHELQRLQATRAGEHVPAPAVLDVDVNLPEPVSLDVGTDGNQE